MNTEMIFCPACSHKLRVPADLMGQRVMCPKCEKEFLAPPRSADRDDERYSAEPRTPRYDAHPRDDEGWDRPDDRDRRRGPSPMPPGIFLIVLGTLAALDNLVKVLFPQAIQQMFANNPMFQGQPGGDMKAILVTSGLVCLAISLATIAGGLAMLSRRVYWLAILGCIAAMLNITDLCCVLGLPVGIWAMIVLVNADVKASFR